MRPRVNARNRPEPMEDEELQQLITERIEEDPVFWTGSGRRRTYVTVEVEDGHVILSVSCVPPWTAAVQTSWRAPSGRQRSTTAWASPRNRPPRKKPSAAWLKKNVGDRRQETRDRRQGV